MLHAFFEIAPDAYDAIAPYAPSGVMAVLVFVLNRVASPLVDAAKAVTKHFEEADKHREAEERHWAKMENLSEKLVGSQILPDDQGLKVMG